MKKDIILYMLYVSVVRYMLIYTRIGRLRKSRNSQADTIVCPLSLKKYWL